MLAYIIRAHAVSGPWWIPIAAISSVIAVVGLMLWLASRDKKYPPPPYRQTELSEGNMKYLPILLLSCVTTFAQNLLPPGAEPQKSPDHVRLSWIAPYTNASSIIVLYQRVGTNFALRAYGYTNDLWLLSLPGTTNYVDFAKTNLVNGVTNRFRLVELRQSRYWTIESGTTNLVEREMLEESLPTNEILWVPQQFGPTNLFLMLEIQSAPTVDGPWSAESTVSANVPLNNRNPLFTRVKIVEQTVQ